jgi:hypothetical protein
VNDAPGREEIDAKLAAAEARTETRFVQLNVNMNRISDSILHLSMILPDKLATVETKLADRLASVEKELGTLQENVKAGTAEVKGDNKFTRWTIVAIVVAALAALWVMQTNLNAAFQSGISLLSEALHHPGALK